MTSAGLPFPSPRCLSASNYILILLAIGIFCWDRSDGFFLFCLAAAACSWWLVELVGWAAPRFVLNITILAMFAYLVWEICTTFLIQSVVISLARFVVIILVCKLFERRRPRDEIELILLSLVVAVSGMMFAPTGILFGLLCLAFACVLIYVVIVRVAWANLQARNAAQRVTPHTPTGEALFARDLRRTVKRSLLVMAPVSLVVFLILPRSDARGFADAWTTQTIQSGFSDVVAFRDVEEITPSDQIVMQVMLTRNPGGQNIGSELYQPYFRGQVIEDQYGARWDPRKTMLGSDDGIFRIMDHPHLEDGSITEDYTVFVPPRGALFSTGAPGFVISDQFSGVSLDLSTMILTHIGGIRPLRYKVTVPVTTSADAYVPDKQNLPAALLKRRSTSEPKLGAWPIDATALPTSLPPASNQAMAEIRSIIGTILPDLPADGMVPRERVRSAAYAIETYLRMHYRYSLSTHQVDKKLDPITDFLKNRKEIGGYCEYFALAMVRLCQTVGIPAREVTGYYGGEFNSVGGYYIVRQRDAHMWVEYFSPDEGWVRADPTASSAGPDPATGVLSRALREIGQWVQDCWLTYVVTFDNDSRRRLWSQLAALFTDPRSRFTWLTWGALVLVSALSASAVPVLRRWPALGWMRKVRGRRARQNVGIPVAEVSGEASFLGELMALLGSISPRRKDMTPREFVEGLSLGAAGNDARWIVGTAYEVLWGGRAMDSGLREQIACAMGRIQAQLIPPHAPSQA